jgi:hypothetical protein
MTLGHCTCDPEPIAVGLCRPDLSWTLWERSASWLPNRRKALRHEAQAFVLEGYPDPRRIAGYGGSDLALPFIHLLKSYKGKDPVPRPQVALPVDAIKLASVTCLDPTAAPRDRAVASLIVMAFFFY